MWTVVGTPFDVVKTRLQTSSSSLYRGVWHCVVSTLRHDGPFAFWRGFVPALLMGWPYSVIMFGVYGQLRPSQTASDQTLSTPSAFDLTLPYVGHCFAAGAASGVAVHCVSNPLTLWMVQLQTRTRSGKPAPEQAPLSVSSKPSPPYTASALGGANSSIHTVQRVLSLGFRGSGVTLAVNVLGNAVFFSTNEVLRHAAAARGNFGLGQTLADAVTGGLTGVIFRALVFPLDVLRSRIMAAPVDAPALTVRRAAREVLAEHGIGGFVRGLSVVVTRAFLINAAGWAVMHRTQRFAAGAAERMDINDQ
uniref:Mitochondrial carrier protein n=1 Tax=Chromera velia CCMP2878 TaxID=1169474 RepID=A0A0G4IBA9_9ALVE|eukprot:Cvel_12788.t1-p1 / transcript=Cvel_12788.t1 / gene=Cvel_12788 / organism=Chromera_velia_CCMP2878 / gene_product=Mitochondrial substrate carrier family protein S, putative / transcript_product=Mitochondrial substrate carrier family protein S, putative / location=Cvel_scaffold851:32351-33265(+) / protein_length=305 / sequence_SO=supercontig / SO=protein_coding / is_pseudo=false